MKMKNIALALPLLAFSVVSCNEKDALCIADPIGFTVSERIGGYDIETDTVYQDTYVTFRTNKNYSSISWKIGTASSAYSGQKNVSLYFGAADQVSIDLSGQSDSPCHGGLQTVRETLHILSKSNSSPLTGFYKGVTLDAPSHLFTVAVRFWKGDRYPWWQAGAFSIHNFPEGYKDSTQNFNGSTRPEVDGIVLSNGYKTFAIDKSGYVPALGVKGYGRLSAHNDSLTIHYSVIDTGYLRQTAQIRYIDKIFVAKRI